MVKKKQAYYKNLQRTIFKSKARFFSIFSIVFLGAAFFAGLRNTPGTMIASIDQYLDDYHFADLTYIVSLGLSQDDIDSIQNIEGIERIEYGYQFDAQMKNEDDLLGIKVYTSEKFDKDMINRPDLLEGQFPQKDNECLIDRSLVDDYALKVGEKITISNDQGTKEFLIVGIVDDTRYISELDRGTNSLGDGTNVGFIEILNDKNDFLAMPDELYDLRDEDILYNQLSVSVKGAKNYNLFSEEYDDYIETVNTKMKSTLSLRMSRLYDDITSDAQKELDKAEKEYNNGYKTYQDSKDLFDSKILEAKIQLTNAKIKLAEKEEEFLKASQGATKEASSLTKEIESLKKQVDQLNQQLKEQKSDTSNTQNNTSQLPTTDDIKEQLPSTDDIKDQLPSQDDMKDQIPSNDKINDTVSSWKIPSTEELSKTLEQISQTLDKTSQAVDGLLQLSDASLQIQKAKLEIQKQENKLTLEELKTNKQLEEAKLKLDDASQKINDAKKELNKIPKGKVYTLTRQENAGIMSFEANKESISSIADVFPLMFFLVSALVSLTTMTRMVEEQRGQSGILRALGYSKWEVIKQYVIYVILATFFACILGIFAGTEFFPRIIYFLYNLMMFKVNAPIMIDLSLSIALQTIFISVFVTLFVTLFVCIQELNLMPSVLMRPKAPKIGKRIFLEKITFIWKRLSFNQKVTMRNILRYKKRFFMSIIGIAGCTGLIITGFGVKSSVSQVVSLQYEEVLKYDALVRLEDNILTKTALQYEENLRQRDEVTNVEYVLEQSINILKNKEDLIGNLVVYRSMDNISNFISFRDYRTGKQLVLDDEGVILSQKTAELLDVEVNDTVDIEVNGTKYNVKVSGITKNYFMNYIYMSQNLYESLTSSQLEVNHAFLNMKKMNQSNQKTLEDYMKTKQYGSISYMDDVGSSFNKQVQSVDMVVIILIVCAGALNFIVLYNLTNINIQERKSEIATIKVLGFRKKEVYDYVFRENILLSIIGSIIGMFFGYVLHQFIIRTVELDMTMFIRTLNPWSYIIAVALTIGFTLFINLTMRRVLNRVNMVESLKSIE